MKKALIIQLIILAIVFTGCDTDTIFGPSKKELELKEKELNQTQSIKEKELAFKEKELIQNTQIKEKQAQLKLEETKAQLENKKSIELAKISSTVEKEKILSLNKQKELDYELNAKDKDNTLEFQKYILIAVIILILLISAGLFIYFNNRRKDKLKAYEDNLDKYFRAKETEAKVQIANKILDTISTGNLSPNVENKLIASLNGSNNPTSQDTPTQIEKKNDEVVHLEVIDENIKKEKEK